MVILCACGISILLGIKNTKNIMKIACGCAHHNTTDGMDAAHHPHFPLVIAGLANGGACKQIGHGKDATDQPSNRHRPWICIRGPRKSRSSPHMATSRHGKPGASAG